MAIAEQFQVSDIRRLVLVGGCVAAAAAANYASALPERAPVAVGAAFLGILLMLRRRPHAEPVVEGGDTPAVVAEPTDRKKRGQRAELEALTASLATVERRLAEHEQRLTSLSGRQSLLQVDARESLAGYAAHLQELETRLSEVEEQTQRIRAHHIDLLRHLNASIADAVAAQASR